MSDCSSLSGELKNLGKETGKQMANFPKNFIRGAVSQVTSKASSEDEAKKKAEMVATHQRIQALEAEMAQIRAQSEQKEGPQILQTKRDLETLKIGKSLKRDEASRQAAGKAEQGRNFKG